MTLNYKNKGKYKQRKGENDLIMHCARVGQLHCGDVTFYYWGCDSESDSDNPNWKTLPCNKYQLPNLFFLDLPVNIFFYESFHIAYFDVIYFLYSEAILSLT